MGRVELVVMAGAESKEWLDKLDKVVARIEKLAAKTGVKTEEAEEVADDDEELVPKKKKKAADFDDAEEETGEEAEEEAEQEEDDEEEEEPAAAPKKRGRKPKVTDKDVNDACKAKVKRLIEDDELSSAEARAKVQSLLKKKFQVDTVSDLEPEQYQAVIDLMSK